MTTAQKIIKYFAIAFAFGLIFGVLSCLMYGLSTISNSFSNKDEIKETLKEIDIESTDVSVLDIDLTYANLIIKKGDTLKAETNDKNITTTNSGNKLIIKEKKSL